MNPLQAPQTVAVIYNIDGRAEALSRTYVVPGCGQLVLGVHDEATIGLPAAPLFYRVVAYFPGPGFAQLVIRSLATFVSAPPILPPPQVLR